MLLTSCKQHRFPSTHCAGRLYLLVASAALQVSGFTLITYLCELCSVCQIPHIRRFSLKILNTRSIKHKLHDVSKRIHDHCYSCQLQKCFKGSHFVYSLMFYILLGLLQCLSQGESVRPTRVSACSDTTETTLHNNNILHDINSPRAETVNL